MTRQSPEQRTTSRDDRIKKHMHRLWKEEGAIPGREADYRGRAEELVAIEDNQQLTTFRPGSPRDRIRNDPTEPLEAVENQGEFPTLTDQGEERTTPRPVPPRDDDIPG
ncbi:DUF2934 domain-containing protein [Tistrella mobilis]|uniref:DUF2934 domain-containing protein n=1 Tax=Tistrella mobilis TaxID=171437 RepID=UPI0035573DBA